MERCIKGEPMNTTEQSEFLESIMRELDSPLHDYFLWNKDKELWADRYQMYQEFSEIVAEVKA